MKTLDLHIAIHRPPAAAAAPAPAGGGYALPVPTDARAGALRA